MPSRILSIWEDAQGIEGGPATFQWLMENTASMLGMLEPVKLEPTHESISTCIQLDKKWHNQIVWVFLAVRKRCNAPFSHLFWWSSGWKDGDILPPVCRQDETGLATGLSVIHWNSPQKPSEKQITLWSACTGSVIDRSWQKLQDRWKSTTHVMIKKLTNLHVYRVKPEQGTVGVKTLHRDHLLPIGYLIRMSNSTDYAEMVRKPPVIRMQDLHKH